MSIVRRTPTAPKAALAGVMLEISFTRFTASIVAFNAEMAPSRSFGRWDLASMVEAWGCREKTVWRERCWVKAVRKDPIFDKDGRPFPRVVPRGHRTVQSSLIISLNVRRKLLPRNLTARARHCASTTYTANTVPHRHSPRFQQIADDRGDSICDHPLQPLQSLLISALSDK